ncbi:MAG: hypothetical protein WC797_01965 [Candidatus Paceibacterota bacterium]
MTNHYKFCSITKEAVLVLTAKNGGTLKTLIWQHFSQNNWKREAKMAAVNFIGFLLVCLLVSTGHPGEIIDVLAWLYNFAVACLIIFIVYMAGDSVHYYWLSDRHEKFLKEQAEKKKLKAAGAPSGGSGHKGGRGKGTGGKK